MERAMSSIEERRRRALARAFRESLSETDFSRLDGRDDALFYEEPRLVQHLDRRARQTVSELIANLVHDDAPRVLDLMASWDSHLPASLRPGRVVGLGLNSEELARNPALDSFVVHDLNRDPRLPFEDGAFDAVINVVSVDYLTDPIAVFEEVARVLRPGGLLVVVFSNRLFETKATRLWRSSSEGERVILVEAFIEHSLSFTPPLTFVSKGLPRPSDDPHATETPFSDPVYAVFAWRPGPGAEQAAQGARQWLEAAARSEVDCAEVARTNRCPHCGDPMDTLEIPEEAVGEWGGNHIHVCFNDRCPYFVRGWSVNYRSGMRGYSYRFMYDPERERCGPLPVSSHRALRELLRHRP
jgi:SAM-dependent methyltransferase